MQEGKTIGQLMEEMRQKAGAQNYHGHDYMDLQRFAENTRHMIIFDVLTHAGRSGKQDFNTGCQWNKVHRQAAQSRHQQVHGPLQGKEAAKAEKP